MSYGLGLFIFILKNCLQWVTSIFGGPQETHLLPPSLCAQMFLYFIFFIWIMFLQTQNATMKTKSKNKVTICLFTLQN